MCRFDDLFLGGLVVLVILFLGLHYIERGTPFRQSITAVEAPAETTLRTRTGTGVLNSQCAAAKGE